MSHAIDKDLTVLGNWKILKEDDSPDHRRMRARGATVVGQQGRGGITHPKIKFRAFNATEEGLTITDSHDGRNPHAAVQETPLEDLTGKVLFPGLGAVPAPVSANLPAPTPIVLPEIATKDPAVPTENTSRIIAVGSMPTAMARPPAVETITLIGEFSDLDHRCHSVQYQADYGLIAIISDADISLKFPKGTFQLRHGKREYRVTFSMEFPVPGFNLVTRIFVDEDASQAQEGSV